MSSYKPTFLGSDRWLRNGIPLDAVKLDAELSLLAASISTIGGETGAANHTFEGGGVGHPLYSLYNPARAFIVRDAANRPPLTTANDGESIFAFATDMEMALNATASYEAFIRIRNIDQSVAFRYGTSMTFGAATAAGANVLRIRVVSAEF